jgi:autotransporter-associated beta strand protein
MKPKSRNKSALALVTAITVFTSAGVNAAIYQWNGNAVGNDSNWATDSNWTGTAPDDANVVGSHRLNVNGAAALTYSAAQGTSIFAITDNRGLVVGSGTSGTMNITGGSFSTLDAVGQDVIGNGNNSTGILNISGGTWIGSSGGSQLGLGGGPGRVSTLTLSNTGNAILSSLFFNSTTSNVNLDGGTLELNTFVNQYIEVSATIRLNGGTLKARQSTPNFISSSGLLQTLVQAGGAVIDTNGFDITIAEPLLEDAGSTGGGLTKNGTGLLTLAAPSTLTGPVDIKAGGISVRGNALSSWLPASFTHSGDSLLLNLESADPSNPAPIDTDNLTVDSAVIVSVNAINSNLSVGQYPLIQYGTKSITGSLTLDPASLPPFVVATIADNNTGLIYLDVTAAPTSFVWSGDTATPGTGDWDTTSLNWNDFLDAFSISGTQTARFPNIAVATAGDSHTVNITGAYSPISVDITNASGNPYTFTGAGKITGTTVVNKSGTGIATFDSGTHDYSGATTISGGALIKQAPDASTGDITVTADNVSFVLDGGITDGADQTLFITGRGATGGGYFFTGSAVQRGALQAHNGANTWEGNIVLNSNSTTLNRIGVQNLASITLTGNITESVAGAGIVFRAGTPGDDITLAGTGTYSYTGQTQLFSNGASIILGANDKLPVGFPVYFGNGGTTVFDLNGFDQQLAGVFGNAIGIQATITNNGTSPSVLTTNVPAPTTYTYLGGITDGDDQTEPFVQTVSLVKTGEGTQILSDFNSYTGTTTVNGGTLVINGDQSSATGAVQVSAATLAGTGTVGGAVTIAAAGVEAAGTINPGPVGAIGTLNVPDTTIAGILACDINATSSDLLAVNGDLFLTGATLAVNPLATPTEAAYTLATYTTLTGTFSASTLPAGYTIDYTTPGEIRLVQATGGYDAWVIENNVTGGPNGDDDKDGISNLARF